MNKTRNTKVGRQYLLLGNHCIQKVGKQFALQINSLVSVWQDFQQKENFRTNYSTHTKYKIKTQNTILSVHGITSFYGSRTIPPWTTIPPRTVTPHANHPSDNWPYANCPPDNYSPENCTLCQLSPRQSPPFNYRSLWGKLVMLCELLNSCSKSFISLFMTFRRCSRNFLSDK